MRFSASSTARVICSVISARMVHTAARVSASGRFCSVVTATYELGEGIRGTIGIIGPKRMDYEKVMDNLKVLKSSLDGVLDKPAGQT